MQSRRKGSVYEIHGQAGGRDTGDRRPMLTLPLLAKMSSAAVAAAITASLTYGQYNIASGPNGSGLMPPASVLHPNVRPGAMLDPLAEMASAMTSLKQERAKADRNRAMIDWLAGLQTRFTVQRFETGLVYKVRYAAAGEAGAVLQDFVAVPYGPELPFAVSLQAGAGGKVRVEGLSCSGQETLSEMDAGAGEQAVETAAMSRVEAYLQQPEAADPALPADCLMARLKRG
jgi:hypothetical protein